LEGRRVDQELFEAMYDGDSLRQLQERLVESRHLQWVVQGEIEKRGRKVSTDDEVLRMRNNQVAALEKLVEIEQLKDSKDRFPDRPR
jgi:hypothetical protein